MSWKHYNGGDSAELWHLIVIFIIFIGFITFIFFFGGGDRLER